MKDNAAMSTEKNNGLSFFRRVESYVRSYAKKCRNSYLRMLSPLD